MAISQKSLSGKIVFAGFKQYEDGKDVIFLREGKSEVNMSIQEENGDITPFIMPINLEDIAISDFSRLVQGKMADYETVIENGQMTKKLKVYLENAEPILYEFNGRIY